MFKNGVFTKRNIAIGVCIIGLLVVMAIGCSETATKEFKKGYEEGVSSVNAISIGDKNNITEGQKESQYRKNVSEILMKSTSSFSELSTLFTNADLTKEWVNDLKRVYVEIEQTYNDLKAINAPTKYKGIHAKIVKGFKTMLESRDLIFEGMAQQDIDLVKKGGDKIDESTLIILDAYNDVEKINNSNK